MNTEPGHSHADYAERSKTGMKPVVVVGAGPAGLGAAGALADAGVRVVLLDQQLTPGGQLYRGLQPTISAYRQQILGKDYSDGIDRLAVVAHPLIDYRPGATVWRIDEPAVVTYSRDGVATSLSGCDVIIATGALERPMPLPGWTLPGVTTAGAAQIMLKAHGGVASGAVLAGSGPLLYLLAVQMIRAGTKPVALVETQTLKQQFAALRYLPAASRGIGQLMQGISYLAEIRRAGVPRYTAASQLSVEALLHQSATRGGLQQDSEAHQDTPLTSVSGDQLRFSFSHRGKTVSIPCAHVCLHQGVIPDTQLTRSLGLQHHWHTGQQCFVPTLNEQGLSSQPHVWVVGDGAVIAGGQAAWLKGAVMGATIARRMRAAETGAQLSHNERSTTHPSATRVNKALIKALAPRRFIDALYPPDNAITTLADTTVVCRCEEITAGAIRRYAANGCEGPNQLKAFSRCGMGPCQGRYCGLTVTRVLADYHGLTPDAVGSYRIRAPIKPVTLQELASLVPTKTST